MKIVEKLNVVEGLKDEKGAKTILGSFDAIEFIKYDKNYTRTPSVIATETKEDQ